MRLCATPTTYADCMAIAAKFGVAADAVVKIAGVQTGDDTCIHQLAGLCLSCQAQCDLDPTAWAEFGHHVDGEQRWREECDRREAEIAARGYRPYRPIESDVPL